MNYQIPISSLQFTGGECCHPYTGGLIGAQMSAVQKHRLKDDRKGDGSGGALRFTAFSRYLLGGASGFRPL